MSNGTIILLAICVILVLLPPRYDPAIRIKEWQIERERERTKPELTEKMRFNGFHWVWVTYADGTAGWHEACDTCGGNCGQCGTSLGMGLPASMDHLIQATGMNKPPAGLPRP